VENAYSKAADDTARKSMQVLIFAKDAQVRRKHLPCRRLLFCEVTSLSSIAMAPAWLNRPTIGRTSIPARHHATLPQDNKVVLERWLFVNDMSSSRPSKKRPKVLSFRSVHLHLRLLPIYTHKKHNAIERIAYDVLFETPRTSMAGTPLWRERKRERGEIYANRPPLSITCPQQEPVFPFLCSFSAHRQATCRPRRSKTCGM
jgi:hypothetical protein